MLTTDGISAPLSFLTAAVHLKIPCGELFWRNKAVMFLRHGPYVPVSIFLQLEECDHVTGHKLRRRALSRPPEHNNLFTELLPRRRSQAGAEQVNATDFVAKTLRDIRKESPRANHYTKI